MTPSGLLARPDALTPTWVFGAGGISSAAMAQRLGSFMLAAGYTALFVLVVLSYDEYYLLAASWWSLLHLTGLLVCALAWLTAALMGRSGVCTMVAFLSWAACLSSVIAWQFAWTGTDLGLLGVADRPILQSFYVHLPAVALILVRRPGFAVLALISCVTIGAIGVGQLSYGRLDAALVMATLWSLSVTLVYLALVWAVMVIADRTDRERSRALLAARQGSWYIARDREGQRLDALVHDRIIAVLAELPSGRIDAHTAEQARVALEELENWTVVADAEAPALPLTGDEMAQKLSTAVAEVGGAEAVQVDIDSAVAAEYPFAAAVALSDAAVEAVRNARLHAGPTATCVAMIVLRADEVVVDVVDDGVGFDVEQLPPTAIGLPIAICERMDRLAGGSADVQSVPGSGTRVRLRWQRPVAA
ncbi:ATP-binding protein [Gordonia alkaliphila]|uniref:Histidine kinase/HSP90-like ATPase domain-containing protein n=1 Tax=Gordonia alkaliphila TaxID=1053547 RepID=A0ABP8ZDX7_9ACTN